MIKRDTVFKTRFSITCMFKFSKCFQAMWSLLRRKRIQKWSILNIILLTLNLIMFLLLIIMALRSLFYIATVGLCRLNEIQLFERLFTKSLIICLFGPYLAWIFASLASHDLYLAWINVFVVASWGLRSESMPLWIYGMEHLFGNLLEIEWKDAYENSYSDTVHCCSYSWSNPSPMPSEFVETCWCRALQYFQVCI